MAFRVHTSDGSSQLFGNDADYAFSEHGLLVVTDGRGTKRTYSSGGWRYVEEYATSEAEAAGAADSGSDWPLP